MNKQDDSQLNIWLAAKLGNLQRVHFLVCQDAMLIHETDRYHNTPLYYAAYAGHSNVVSYLLKQGASYDHRTMLAALNTDIQQLLKSTGTTSNPLKTTKSIEITYSKRHGIDEVFSDLFKNHVRREQISQANMVQKSLLCKEDFTDFSIIVYENENSMGEVFHVHLLVLCSRWKKFRKEYVAKITHSFLNELETKSKNMSLEEKSNFWRSEFAQKMLQIDTTLRDLKGKMLKLVGIEPELFYSILNYLYTLNFKNTVQHYLENQLLSTNLSNLIPRVLQSIKSLGLTDCLQNLIRYFCSAEDPRYSVEMVNADFSYLSWKTFDFVKRDKEETYQAIQRLSTKYVKDVKQCYDLVDRTIRNMCCKSCSDIVLYSKEDNKKHEFYCHKMVLVHSNHFFRTLLLGNFIESELLNDGDVKSIASLEIDPPFPNSLKILLEHIYFPETIDARSSTSQETINTLILAQKYDEHDLVSMLSNVLLFKCDSSNIFELYQLASSLFLNDLTSNLEKRINLLYNMAPAMFDTEWALKTIQAMKQIGAMDMVRRVEQRGMEDAMRKFLPFAPKLYTDDICIIVEKIVQRKICRVLLNDEKVEDSSDDIYFREKCPYCEQEACNSSSMFSHFALYCPTFTQPRTQLLEFARDRMQNVLQDVFIPPENTLWEPWFLLCNINIREDTLVTRPLSTTVFQTMEKELGILGYVPKDYCITLRHHFKLDLPYQKQIDRIQKYITTIFLPTLFAQISAR